MQWKDFKTWCRNVIFAALEKTHNTTKNLLTLQSHSQGPKGITYQISANVFFWTFEMCFIGDIKLLSYSMPYQRGYN